MRSEVDLDAKIKFLVAETLRGVGGLVFVAHGNHCANELGRRNYVTGEMWKNKPPFRLAVNKATSDEIATDTASMPQSDEILRIRSRPCPEHGSACLEDGGLDRSPLSDSLTTAKDPDRGSVSWRQRSSWPDGFRKEVPPQRHFGSSFHSRLLTFRSWPVCTATDAVARQ